MKGFIAVLIIVLGLGIGLGYWLHPKTEWEPGNEKELGFRSDGVVVWRNLDKSP